MMKKNKLEIYFPILSKNIYPHILLVDNNSFTSITIREYLLEKGFRVSVANSFEQACRKIASLHFDFLLIEESSSYHLYKQWWEFLCKQHSLPFLLIVDPIQYAFLKEHCSGLFLQDCLIKPFDVRELITRIKTTLRSISFHQKKLPPRIVFGPYVFVTEKRQLTCKGALVNLTQRERDMMSVFVQRLGENVSRYELLSKNSAATERTVDVQINALREKIEKNPSSPLWLKTVRGIGYCFSGAIIQALYFFYFVSENSW